MATIASLIVKIGAQDEELRKALEKAGIQGRALDADLKKLGNTSLGQAAQKSLGALQTTMKGVTDQQQRMAQSAVNMAEGINRVGGPARIAKTDLESMDRTLRKGLDSFRALGKDAPAELQKVAAAVARELKPIELPAPKLSLNELAAGLKSAGTLLTVGITAPLVALGTIATRAAADFESSFAGVRKTVDGVVDEFGKLTPAGAKLRQDMRDLSKEIPVNVNELNRLAEAAGQLGIKQDNILQFTRVMAQLGTATNLSADQAATAIAKIQNIFGAAGQDVDRFGATLVALGNAGASTESEIVEMSLRIAGAGRTIGITQGEVLAFASTLASVGINAEAGGSAISRIFLKMNDAVQSGGDALQEFARVSGRSAGQFKDVFQRDAAAAVELFIKGLARLKDGGENVNQTMEGLVGKNIILKDTLLRLSGSGDLLNQNLRLQGEAWKANSALTKEAEERFKTFDSQMQIMKNKLGDVAITLGDALLPALLDFIKLVEPLVRTVAEMAELFGELPEPIRLTALGVLGITAAVGPATYATGLLLGNFQTLLPLAQGLSGAQAIGGLTSALGKLGPAITGVQTALAASPLLLGILTAGATGLGVAGFVAAAGAARDRAIELGNALGDLNAKGGSAGQPLDGLSDKAGEAVLTLSQAAAAAENATGAITFMGKAISIIPSAPVNALGATIARVRSELAGLTVAQKNQIVQAKALGLSTQQIAKDLRISEDAVDAFGKQFTASTRAAATASKEAEKEVTKLQQALKKVQEQGAGLSGPIKGLRLYDATEDIKAITELYKKIQDIQSGAFQPKRDEALLDGPIPGFELIQPADIERSKSGLGELAQAFGTLAQISGGSFGGIVQGFGQIIGAMNVAQTASDNLAKAVKAGTDNIGTYATAIASWSTLAITGFALLADHISSSDARMRAAFKSQNEQLEDLSERYNALRYELPVAEARRLAEALLAAQRIDPNKNWADLEKALKAINAELTRLEKLAGIASSRYGPSQQDLKDMAEEARQVFDFMLQSGEYTAEQLAKAYYDWQKAMAAAGNAAAQAWVDAHDAANKSALASNKAIDTLLASRKQLADSYAGEAEEEHMGVVERNARDQVALIDKQIEDIKRQAEEQAKAAQEAGAATASSLDGAAKSGAQSFRDMFGDVRTGADEARGHIDSRFNGLKYRVEVDFYAGETPNFGSPRGVSTGGLVRPGGLIQPLSGGGIVGQGRVLPFGRSLPKRIGTDTVHAMLTPQEVVLTVAHQENLANALSREPQMPDLSGDVVLNLDGRTVARASLRQVLLGGDLVEDFRNAMKAAS